MPRPTTAPIRKQVNLPADLAEKVENYRFAHRLTTESEAIRRLIELGLQAGTSKPAKGPKITSADKASDIG